MATISPCGGGVYAFAGPSGQVPGTKIHGEVLGLANLDFNEGLSGNVLGEIGVGGPFSIGGTPPSAGEILLRRILA